MRIPMRLVGLVSALGLSLAACSSTPAPFEGIVDNTTIGDDCLKVNCWQPTQFGPQLVEEESVSLEEQVTSDGIVTRAGWPNNGDSVEVVCISKGGTYQNHLGQTINDWYGVRILEAQLEPNAKDNPRLRKTPDGRDYLGFIGISWVTGGEGKQAPVCPRV